MHFERYAEYLAHPVYRALRTCALARTGGLCARCAAPATEVHHLRYPKPWGTFDVLDNLQPLCHACHCAAHGKE